MKLLQRIYRMFLLVFRNEIVFLMEDTSAERLPQEPAKDAKVVSLKEHKENNKKERRGKGSNESGAWYYLDNVLDTLDKYFVDLKKFKKHDPDTYDLYSKLGGAVLSKEALAELYELPASWRAGKKPAFGLVHFTNYNDDDGSDTIYANMIYFRKHEQKWNVQKTNSDLYELCVFYNDEAKRKNSTCIGVVYMSVGDDGDIKLLKERVGSSVHIKSKKGRGSSSFVVQRWETPVFLRIMCDTKKEKEGKTITEDQLAKELLCIAATLNESSSAGLQVRAAYGGLMACFAVDMLRTPYFFKDRNKTINYKGKTKKIFHIVRTHKRTLADGSEQNVKSHFRGERKFKWHKYDVCITMPGYHHRDIKEFTAKSFDEDLQNPVPNSLDMKQLGEALSESMSI